MTDIDPAIKRWEPLPGYGETIPNTHTPPRPSDQIIADHEADLEDWLHIAKYVGTILAIAAFMFVALYGLTGA